MIEVAEKQIRDNSSEANLLPEFDVIKNHYIDIDSSTVCFQLGTCQTFLIYKDLE